MYDRNSTHLSGQDSRNVTRFDKRYTFIHVTAGYVLGIQNVTRSSDQCYTFWQILQYVGVLGNFKHVVEALLEDLV